MGNAIPIRYGDGVEIVIDVILRLTKYGPLSVAVK
jgi:hypothetical protein